MKKSAMTAPEIIYTQAVLPLAADADRTRADAVAVSAGRIAAVGAASDLLGLAGAGTRVVPLGGRTLLPGFHDAHCHVLGFGLTLAAVALTSCRTIPDLVGLLQTRADESGAGPETWVRGRGYSQNVLAEGRHPTRQDLDGVGGGLPFVLIIHASGHAVAVNSRVLQKAGITRDTPDPAGGTIVRDGRGEPTGLLLETAVNLAYDATPEPARGEKIAALGRATRALNAMGITSAVDATLGVAARDSLAEIVVYQEAAQTGALSVRCTLMMMLTQLAALDAVPAPDALTVETDRVRIGPAKVFTDGALTTRTALLRSPFVGGDSLGTAVWRAEELDAMVLKAHAAGWQVAAHAIGDGAIDLCLDAFGRAQARHPRADARHRVEHAMLLWPDQLERMARQGVLPIYQPEFILRFGDAYKAALGPSRAARLMPYAETLASGLPLVFSSDLPVVPGAPLDGIAAACLRQAPSGETLGDWHRVSALDALRAYTEGAARSVFLEDDRGRIAPGHRADFVVLDGDPLTLPPDEWTDGLAVRATILGGKVVFGDVES
jgi:predicted amidohydrolase YtcJ